MWVIDPGFVASSLVEDLLHPTAILGNVQVDEALNKPPLPPYTTRPMGNATLKSSVQYTHATQHRSLTPSRCRRSPRHACGQVKLVLAHQDALKRKESVSLHICAWVLELPASHRENGPVDIIPCAWHSSYHARGTVACGTVHTTRMAQFIPCVYRTH